MSEYAAGEVFAGSWEAFAQTGEWLATPEVSALTLFTCAYRIGDSSPAMIRAVRPAPFGVSSASTAQTCPA